MGDALGVLDEISLKTPEHWRYDVFLDGVKVRGAVSASVSKGVVEAMHLIDGHFSVKDQKKDILRGRVEIRRRP